MPADALIDTGGILAFLHRRDRWHSACAAAVDQLHLPMITSQAVTSLHILMSRCCDRPMDYAGATLVHLGRTGIGDGHPHVDRADFETYRIEGRRRFRSYPASPRKPARDPAPQVILSV